ncbi:helix-turn-helix transcriptional regulator [Halobacteriovorax sp. DA5]|uniref:helix-turn-helix domain-containing protein n=1 Tax=Halobacteriovorax sp. DA5 TaxID=2067553 RepID=UPI000CD1B089|nr:helix-turn-helix transcriptional regulator [Halobacteriovorax sp. DA5]POB13868.1 hypothetical protein C0Z22_07350 [Halobacteriovorax sp. DA5]
MTKLKLKEVLRELINEYDITVASLARKSGVPKTNLNNWLNGGSPNIEQVQKVADFFDVSFEYLAFGKKQSHSLDDLLDKVELHTGLYEISIKKVSKKRRI